MNTTHILLTTVCSVILFLSCASVNNVLRNRSFGKDGYRIESPYGTFQYQKGNQRKELIVGDGYETRKYIETTGDQKVDIVEYQGNRYTRKNDGNTDLFSRADQEWNEYTELLNVQETHKKWKEMSTDEILKQQRFFQSN